MKKVKIDECSGIAEIINEAISSGDDFYVFRTPCSENVYLNTSCHLTDVMPDDEDVFAIGTFNSKTFFLVNGRRETTENPHHLPAQTQRKDYLHGANKIISEIKTTGGKTVYSRVEHRDAPTDIGGYYLHLLNSNPTAYVFLFRAGELGTWIGASPELLLRSDESGAIESVSLAGTRKNISGNTDDIPAEGWDDKNLEEQQLVTDAIAADMTDGGYSVRLSPLMTRRAGAVEHLFRRITGARSDDNAATPLQMAQTLAPTPALCGYPREVSKERIGKYEQHQRICYGGFSGIVRHTGQVTLYVTLRCASIWGNTAALYLGGGLTSQSDAEQEWEETCAKSQWYII